MRPPGQYSVQQSGVTFKHEPSQNIDSGASSRRTAAQYLEVFKKGLQYKVLSHPNPNELVFSLAGVDVSFANALRRIMISEVATMAIEIIYLDQNTSICHDEVLAHRIGLIPLLVNPAMFDLWVPSHSTPDSDGTTQGDDGAGANDYNTLVFRLDVHCKGPEKDGVPVGGAVGDRYYNDGAPTSTPSSGKGSSKSSSQISSKLSRGGSSSSSSNDSADDVPSAAIAALASSADDETDDDEEIIGAVPSNLSLAGLRAEAKAIAKAALETSKGELPKRPYTRHVYAGDLQWIPQGDQLARLCPNGERGPRPVHDDILLTKLRLNQQVILEAHARKSIGKDHAKYSPVATASYRLMPRVTVNKRVFDDDADALVLYEPGVFDIVEVKNVPGKNREAVLANEYACTMSRNYMRSEVLKESISIDRVPDHFIFSIEAVGMMSAVDVLLEAIEVLKGKCERLSKLIEGGEEEEGIMNS